MPSTFTSYTNRRVLFVCVLPHFQAKVYSLYIEGVEGHGDGIWGETWERFRSVAKVLHEANMTQY